jgi:uncharacterized caspase-like protein
MYTGSYARSFALVVGIDAYENASPLHFATSDANAIANLLRDELGFTTENVSLLTDKNATKSEILRHYMAFTQDGTNPDDRILIFFAGHGHTVTSNRGEVGFLVPYDGHPDDLSTLIRWDELTRNSDLITAKHLLFIMDACYGGLAITRSFKPGGMRFLEDMLRRVSRQVLTAGKADEFSLGRRRSVTQPLSFHRTSD